MKLHKIYLFAAVAFVAAFSSCSDDDNIEKGQPAGKYNVTFVSYSTETLASDATSFDVILQREDATGALTVPLNVLSADSGFVIPAKAEFAEGNKVTSVNVQIPSNMKYNTNYSISIQIPEEYTNPYLTQDACPIYKNTILKEDYAVKYTGTMIDNFLYAGDEAETWPVELEYSPSQDLYRVKDLFVEDYHLFFKWDTSTNVVKVTNSSGTALKYWDTGYYMDSYAEDIVCYVNQAKFYYEPETKTFHLPFYWYLIKTNGGWGIYEDQIVLK